MGSAVQRLRAWAGVGQGNEHLGQKESQEFRSPTVTKTTEPVWNARAPDFVVHNPNTLLRVQVIHNPKTLLRVQVTRRDVVFPFFRFQP